MKPLLINFFYRWLVLALCFLALLFGVLPTASGEIAHRYFFSEKTLEDLVGDLNGKGPTSNEFDPIKFSEDVPAKASGFSLDLSEVGERRISGVTLEGSILNEKKGSYALWFKPMQEYESERSIFIVASVPLKDGMTLALKSRSRVFANAKGNTILGTLPVAAKNEWHHAALIWDATSDAAEESHAELFIDGELAGSTTFAGDVDAKYLTCGTLVLKYGQNDNGDYFADTQYIGLIYDLQIYNDSLTPGQVRKLYENPGRVLDEIPAKAKPGSLK